MKVDDQRRVTELLQAAAGCLCADLPDRLVLGLDDDVIWFRFECWSPALTRQRFDGTMDLSEAEYILGDDHADMTWEDVALPMVRALFGSDIEQQRRRHTSAHALGLCGRGSYDDLPYGRMLIDRTLLARLDAAKIDIRATAATISAADCRELAGYHMDRIRTAVGGREVELAHDRVGPPVISTCVRIGTAHFDGTELDVPDVIPSTIAAAATGRPLSDLVLTGTPTLDARRIAFVQVGPNFRSSDQPDRLGTRIFLEPDLVELGAAAHVRPGRTHPLIRRGVPTGAPPLIAPT